MIYIAYYSLGGNTARFAHKLVRHPRLAPHAKAVRLFADGPHGERSRGYMISTDESYPREPRPFDCQEASVWRPYLRKTDTLLVLVPSYGRFNHNLGHTVDFTPAILRPYLAKADGAVYFGNRNFGKDYCAAKSENPSLPAVREVELQGTSEDIESVVDWLCA